MNNIISNNFKFNFSMFSPPQYWRTYSATASAYITNRKERYDKHGQLFSITLSPKTGDKIPFMAKLPTLSSDFTELPPNHHLCSNREGIFNGLYYVSRNFTPNQLDINPPCNQRAIGNPHITKLWASPRYVMVKDLYQHVQDNIMSDHQGIITKKQQRVDFNQSPQLIGNCTYKFYTTLLKYFLYVKSICLYVKIYLKLYIYMIF